MSSHVLADSILVAHGLVVLFNVGSLPLIWIGRFMGWRFVRNFYFRSIHLFLIGLVAIEALVGAVCPLTAWENALRGGSQTGAVYAEGGFIANWVGRLIYYEFDPWVFTFAYVAFFGLVLATWFLVKPDPRRKN